MVNEMDVETLSRAAADTSWRVAPEPVRQRVVDLVIDALGAVALGSSRAELIRLVETYDSRTPPGDATVLGSRRTWPAGAAAFLNGCAGAADQLQDGHRLARGHPAAHTVPAALALAEEQDSDGSELLAAVLAGYEVGARLGIAMGGTPPGVHDIGTWGQVATAATTARLLAPGDPDVMRSSLELAASGVLLTDARTVFTGHTGGHLFLGASIQTGMTAGLAALGGLSPAPGAFDRHFAAVAAAHWTPGDLGVEDASWSRWEVMNGYVKRHPTCAHLHGVNDAVEDLLQQDVRAEAVAKVEVHVPSGVLEFAAPAFDELAARFSIPASVAVALVTGRLEETSLTDEVLASPAVHDLAGRVEVSADPQLEAGYPAGRPARVTIELVDGTRHSAQCQRPKWDADRSPAPGEVRAKARRLLRARFGPGGDETPDNVAGLATGERARELGAKLRRCAQ